MQVCTAWTNETKIHKLAWQLSHLCALQSFLLMHQVHGIRIECCASVPAQGTMFRFWNTIYVRSNLQIAWPYMALCDKFDLTTFSCVLFIRCMVELSYFSIFSFYNLGLMPDVAMKKTRKTPPPLWYGQQKGESSFPWHQRSKGTTAAFWNRLELRGVDANGDKSDQRDVTRCQWPQRKEKDTVHRKEMYRNVSWSRRNDVTATSKKKIMEWPKPGASIKSLTHRTVGQVQLLWRRPTILRFHLLSFTGWAPRVSPTVIRRCCISLEYARMHVSNHINKAKHLNASACGCQSTTIFKTIYRYIVTIVLWAESEEKWRKSRKRKLGHLPHRKPAIARSRSHTALLACWLPYSLSQSFCTALRYQCGFLGVFEVRVSVTGM